MILPANEVYISGIALKATTVTEGWRETDSDMHKARIMGSGQQN